jgi:hypothetical protein
LIGPTTPISEGLYGHAQIREEVTPSMIARSPSERAPSPRPTPPGSTLSVAPSPRTPSPDAVEFVRFCYRRRRVGWPELYDEMCAVAGRGLFRGWGADELGAEGIAFTLFEMPALAALVHRIVAEDHDRRMGGHRTSGGSTDPGEDAARGGARVAVVTTTAARGEDLDQGAESTPATLRLAHAGA